MADAGLLGRLKVNQLNKQILQPFEMQPFQIAMHKNPKAKYQNACAESTVSLAVHTKTDGRITVPPELQAKVSLSLFPNWNIRAALDS